jgi:hypothetical protein
MHTITHVQTYRRTHTHTHTHTSTHVPGASEHGGLRQHCRDERHGEVSALLQRATNDRGGSLVSVDDCEALHRIHAHEGVDEIVQCLETATGLRRALC